MKVKSKQASEDVFILSVLDLEYDMDNHLSPCLGFPVTVMVDCGMELRGL